MKNFIEKYLQPKYLKMIARIVLVIFIAVLANDLYRFFAKPLGIPEAPTNYKEQFIETYTEEAVVRQINNVVLHHTVTIPSDLEHFSTSARERLGDSPNRMRIKQNGQEKDIQNAIGYHWIVYAYNNKVHTLQLLPDSSVGYHAGDYHRNIDSIAIAVVGDLSKRELHKKELKAIKKILKRYPKAHTLAHFHIKNTACGKAFDKYKEEFQSFGERRVVASKIIDGEEIVFEKIIEPITQGGAIINEDLPKSIVSPLDDLYYSMNGAEEITANFTRYYTPTLDQDYYLHDPQGNWGKFYPKNETERRQAYEQDFKVNCHGDCLNTASGKRLTPKQAGWIVACPPEYPFDTEIITPFRTLKCWDRGGAIKDNRFDLWTGIGNDGLKFMRESDFGGEMKVFIHKHKIE